MIVHSADGGTLECATFVGQTRVALDGPILVRALVGTANGTFLAAIGGPNGAIVQTPTPRGWRRHGIADYA